MPDQRDDINRKLKNHFPEKKHTLAPWLKTKKATNSKTEWQRNRHFHYSSTPYRLHTIIKVIKSIKLNDNKNEKNIFFYVQEIDNNIRTKNSIVFYRKETDKRITI